MTASDTALALMSWSCAWSTPAECCGDPLEGGQVDAAV
jgi:hypothetical protein